MCEGIAKLLLTVINLVFLLVSLAFMGAGVILAFLPDIILDNVYGIVKDQLNTLSPGDQFQIPATAAELKEVPLIYELGVFLFVFGLVLFVISFMGCCGVCCSCCKSLLILFSVILIVIIVIEVTFFALFFVRDSALHGQIKSNLAKKLPDPYVETDFDIFALTMNIINYQFKCCGLDGQSDYNMSPNPVTINGMSATLTEPLSCKAHIANVDDGCYDKLQDLIQDNIIWAGLVAGGLCALQLLEVICAIIIWKDSSKVSPA